MSQPSYGSPSMTKRTRPLDQLYAKPLQDIVDFTFDETVTHVFADMINRSVPGYAHVINMIGILAGQYAQPHSHLYDLGCSLGACTLSMQHHVQTDATLIAVDNAPAMIKQLQTRLPDKTKPHIQLRCEDIQTTDVHNASVIILNYTLQFIDLTRRQDILRKLYHGLLPGGLLILSEKILHPDATTQHTLETLHHQFKKTNGYSDLEIAQKRAALEQTLRPESMDTHLKRLQNAGFEHTTPWFQCLNFASIMAIK